MLEKLKLGTTLNAARELMPDLSYYDSGSGVYLNTHDYSIKGYRGNIDLKFKNEILIDLSISFYKGECNKVVFDDFKEIYADLLNILKDAYGKPKEESSGNPSYEGIENDSNRHDMSSSGHPSDRYIPIRRAGWSFDAERISGWISLDVEAFWAISLKLGVKKY